MIFSIKHYNKFVLLGSHKLRTRSGEFSIKIYDTKFKHRLGYCVCGSIVNYDGYDSIQLWNEDGCNKGSTQLDLMIVPV